MKDFSRYFIFIAATVFIADQVSKYFVRVSGNFTKNYGAGFGILQNQTTLLIITSIAILVLLLLYYKQIPKKYSYQTFTAFILGGLLGNLSDRMFLGFVTDFINLKVWPSFNIADACISAGVIGLIIWMFKEK
ncbi:signal peptidase II [Candidatus Woesearchaeota archaeon]|nr:signal peptidase II [Candidatus Woesearchaeota archaeon]